MNDSGHKGLTDHIRKTMQEHETPYAPGAWEEFARHRAEANREKRRLWMYYTLAACLLAGLLLVPIGLYMNSTSSESGIATRAGEKAAARTTAPGRRLNRTQAPERPGNELYPHRETLNPSLSDLPTPVGQNRQENPLLSGTKETKDAGPTAGKKNGLTGRTPSAQSAESVASVDRKRPIRAIFSKSGAGRNGDSGTSSSGKHRSADPGAVAATGSESAAPFSDPALSTSAAELSRTDLMAVHRLSPRQATGRRWTLRPPVPAPAKVETDTPEEEKVRSGLFKPNWSVALSPQTPYSRGNTTTARTVGGGVYSEFALNKRFSLFTGLSMTGQTVGLPMQSVVFTTSTPQLTAKDVRLLAVDLPVNLKLRVGKLTKPLFSLSAGLSSLSFLNETYRNTYQQQQITPVVVMQNGTPVTVRQVTVVEEVQSVSEPAFRTIYWGRILNLAAGIERPLGKQFLLSVEPYLKYPLGPLTRENILLGSGGINLRVGLNPSR